MHKSIKDLFPQTFVNVNGTISNAEEAKVSVFDRGFLYGDSIYEVTYTEDRNILFFDEHLDRLEHSAGMLDLTLYYSREQIIEETLKTLKTSNIPRAYIRIIITRGETAIGLDPTISDHNNLVIIVKPQAPYPTKFYDDGLYLTIASILRNDAKATNPAAKSGNYLNNVMAMAEARKIGADDAIMVNNEGYLTEGTTFNIWMVKNGKVSTPAARSGLLMGITRAKLLKLCHENSIGCQETLITPDQILQADEVFITSSTKGLVPVSRLDDRKFERSNAKISVTSHLSHLYNKYVKNYKLNQKYTY